MATETPMSILNASRAFLSSSQARLSSLSSGLSRLWQPQPKETPFPTGVPPKAAFPFPQSAPAIHANPIRVAFVISGAEILWEHALSAHALIQDVTTAYTPVATHMLRLEDDLHTSIFSTSTGTYVSALELERDETIGRSRSTRTHIVDSLNEILRGHSLPSAVVAIGHSCCEELRGIEEVAGRFRDKRIPIFSVHKGDDEAGYWAYHTLSRQSGGTFHSVDEDTDITPLMAVVSVYATGKQDALCSLANEASRPHLAHFARAVLDHLPRPSTI